MGAETRKINVGLVKIFIVENGFQNKSVRKLKLAMKEFSSLVLLFCKGYLIVKKLKHGFSRGISNNTRFPEQYKDEFNTEEKNTDKNVYGATVVFFGDILVHNQKAIDPFFTIKGPKDLDVHCFSRSCFDLSKRTIGNNGIIIILLKQSSRGVENI